MVSVGQLEWDFANWKGDVEWRSSLATTDEMVVPDILDGTPAEGSNVTNESP